MKRGRRFALIFVSLLVLVACDARTSAKGKITSSDGHPIAGASVQLLDKKNGKAVEATSGADGSYKVTRIHGVLSGPFALTVSKTGYVTFEREIQAKQQNEIDVTLSRNSSQ